ncbi:hypothetical protein CO655_24260 [Rhizobium sp. M1]|nr:hypothetical protein CO655_24260 [Rhizobium sp. M1]
MSLEDGSGVQRQCPDQSSFNGAQISGKALRIFRIQIGELHRDILFLAIRGQQAPRRIGDPIAAISDLIAFICDSFAIVNICLRRRDFGDTKTA